MKMGLDKALKTINFFRNQSWKIFHLIGAISMNNKASVYLGRRILACGAGMLPPDYLLYFHATFRTGGRSIPFKHEREGIF